VITAESEIARKENGGVIVRAGGVRLRWELGDLSSIDGHALRAAFVATVQPVDEAAERKLLEDSLLADKTSLTTADIVAFFLSALESAARRTTAALDINAIFAGGGQKTLQDNLIKAATSLAFACGLEVHPPFDVELDSPTLRAAQQGQRLAALQAERAARSTAMLKQFEEFRAAAPDMPAGQILQRLAPADPGERAEMLRAVLICGAKESTGQKLFAAAGPNLIRIDSPELESSRPPTTEILSPTDALGPFRSVQKAMLDGKNRLLIGARSGVLVVDPENLGDTTTYRDPGAIWQGGFNAASACGDQICATHAQGGLTCWKAGQFDQPKIAIRPGGCGISPFSPRFLCSLGENRWVCAIENRLLEIDAQGTARVMDDSASFPIVGLLPIGDGEICVVHEDGELCRRDRRLAVLAKVRRCGRITAASVVPWLQSVRILIAGEDGSLLCAGLDDELVTHYLNPYSGMCWIAVAAAADRVAAVSADRQRVLIWPSWDARKSPAEIHIPSLVRHRVADIEFA